MKLAQIANKSWWVPERNRTKLAVEINNPDQYLGAVEEKLLALVEAEGMPKALQTAQWLMEPDGVVLQETDDPEQLVGQLLATASLGEMVRAGAPWLAKAASQEDAEEAVSGQPELTLGDFLT